LSYLDGDITTTVQGTSVPRSRLTDNVVWLRQSSARSRFLRLSDAEVTGGECRSCNGAHDEEGGEYRVARRSSPDGRELRGIRHSLEPLVAGCLSEEVQADGDEFFRVAWEHAPKASSPCTPRSPIGLPGRVVAEDHLQAPRQVRDRWLRADNRAGPPRSPRWPRKDGGLVYVDGCGTGWSNDLSCELRKLLEDVATKMPAVSWAEECGRC